MKILFLFLIFISSNLLALEKTYAIGEPQIAVTNQGSYRGDSAGCNSKADEFDSYADVTRNLTGNSSYNTKCINPNETLLKLKDIIGIDVYSANPHCVSFYANDADSDNGISSYHLGFQTSSTAVCNYECNQYSRDVEHTDDAIWSEDECKWIEPCIEPDDKAVGAYDNIDDCNSALIFFSSNLILAGNLYCQSCNPDRMNLWQHIENCPSGYLPKNGLSGNETLFYCIDERLNSDNNDSCVPPMISVYDFVNGDYKCVNPDANNGNDTNNSCLGYKYTSSIYPFSQYSYYGVTSENVCSSLLDSTIDNVLLLSDKSSECLQKYCFTHSNVNDCSNLNVLDYKPSSDYIYKSSYDENMCNNSVDGVRYTNSSFIVPDNSNCPNIGFCFLKTVSYNSDNNNSLGTNPSDLNSSNPDALLNSQNDSNKHLKSINDKLDKTNDKLEDLKGINSDILTNGQDMKKDLDKLSLNSDKSLNNQKENLNKLDNLNSTLKNNSNNLDAIRKQLVVSHAVTRGKLSDISNKQDTTNKNLYDGLFSDENPFDKNISDGSGSFGDLTQNIKDNLNITYETGLFNLSSMAPEIPTIQFNLVGTSFTMLSPSMFSSLPISDIRALIMFIFALMGFITVIRTV